MNIIVSKLDLGRVILRMLAFSILPAKAVEVSISEVESRPGILAKKTAQSLIKSLSFALAAEYRERMTVLSQDIHRWQQQERSPHAAAEEPSGPNGDRNDRWRLWRDLSFDMWVSVQVDLDGSLSVGAKIASLPRYSDTGEEVFAGESLAEVNNRFLAAVLSGPEPGQAT